MRNIAYAIAATSLALASSSVAMAANEAPTVTDCPLADAPFSVQTPLIDILLSASAKTIIEDELGKSFDDVPPQFAGTTTPTFAAILSVESAVSMFGGDQAALARIDERLRALPVTDADKLARCARYDNDVPVFDLPEGKPRILLFQKIVGYYHESTNSARDSFLALADEKGWAMVATDKAGAINSETLSQFDVILWNNVSGDVLTLSQRQALRDFVEGGGGFVAVHASAGDPAYFWDWYADTLIGARFLGHPADPQFQDGRVVVEDRSHAAAEGLPGEWVMNEEWYSFQNNPRDSGARIVATLDESSYAPVGHGGQNLAMGDHPVAWSKIVGKGRVFYSAFGHQTKTYEEPNFRTIYANAIKWAAHGENCDCAD